MLLLSCCVDGSFWREVLWLRNYLRVLLRVLLIYLSDKPHITKAPKDINVTSDAVEFTFRFDCEGAGDLTLPLFVSWSHNGTNISSGMDSPYSITGGQLLINSTAETVAKYTGVYACTLGDGISRDRREAKLELEGHSHGTGGNDRAMTTFGEVTRSESKSFFQSTFKVHLKCKEHVQHI